MIHTKGKTFQEVIDEIAGVLDTQGKKCVNDRGGCVYGDGKGNHCAIGWLLPEERDDIMRYIPGVLGLSVAFEDLGPNDEFIRVYEYDLMQIQNIHDQAGDLIRPDWDVVFEKLPGMSLEKFKNFYETGGVK